MVLKLSWEDCLRKGIVIRSFVDTDRSKNLVILAKKRLEFWSFVNHAPDSLKVEAYYEIVKELIFAHLYRSGYNCSNHLCLISQVKEFELLSDEFIFVIDTLRKLRNDLSYRGIFVSDKYFVDNKGLIDILITQLFSYFI